MQGFTKGNKLCATCGLWSGSRSLSGTHHLVNADPKTIGYCSSMRIDKAAISTCGKWQVYPSLK